VQERGFPGREDRCGAAPQDALQGRCQGHGYEQCHGRPFDEVESYLSRDGERARGSSSLTLDNAKHAARGSWQRITDAVERAVPGDSNRDGK
jgi:hypothetical protein